MSGGTKVPEAVPVKKLSSPSVWGFASAMFGMGFMATGAQVHVVRDFLSMFAGDELSIAVVFACWLAGMSAGTWAGGLISRLTANPWRWFMLAGIGSAVLFPMMIILLRWTGTLYGLPSPGEIPSAGSLLATGVVFITPFPFSMGLTFPLACKAAPTHSDGSLVVGKVYILESLGAIAGGVAVGIILPGMTSAMTSIGILCLPLFLGISLANLGTHKIIAYSLILLILIVTALSLLGITTDLDEISTGWRFERMSSGGVRVAWSDTAYQHLDLSNAGGQYNLFAQGKITTSFPDPYSAKPRAHMILSQHPDPKLVLLVGSTFAEFTPAALFHPIQRLDIVDLDPGVMSLLKPFLNKDESKALGDDRVFIHMTDGRRFLNQSTRRWDLIFSDSPDPSTASLNRFYTREFYTLVQKHLKGSGVFCTRVSSVINLQGMEMGDRVRSIELTMESVFSHVLVLPGQETFLCASDKDHVLLDNPDALAARISSLHVQDPRFSPQQFKMLVQAEFVRDLQQKLHAMGQRPLNTDERPVTYLQSLVAWSKMTKDPAGNIIQTLMSLPSWFWFILSASIILFAGIFVLFRSSSKPGNKALGISSICVAVVGASGIAMELVLSYAYQSLAGSLYRELGLIVAAFMAGLVLGGVIVQRLLKHHPATALSLAALLFAFAVFNALLPLLLSSDITDSLPMYLTQLWIITLVLFTGSFTGTIFPVAAQLALKATGQAGYTGGRLDAWDHGGASISVLITGLILIPMMGRTQTCLVLAMWCFLAGMIALIMNKRIFSEKSQ